MKEIWKDIKNYEGLYQVSSLGKVERIKNKRSTTFYIEKGYYFVYLFKNSKRKKHKVHVLVAESFLGHIRCGMNQVIDHIDENKLNNEKTNLRIVTQRENMHFHYGEEVGVHLRGKTWYSRINIEGKPKYLGRFSSEEEAYIATLN